MIINKNTNVWGSCPLTFVYQHNFHKCLLRFLMHTLCAYRRPYLKCHASVCESPGVVLTERIQTEMCQNPMPKDLYL